MEASWKTKYKKAVTFSYDDGVTQDIRLIELLNRYGLKATFNLNSELLGHPGMLFRAGQRISHYKIHPEKVRETYEGHEVAVHTLTHPNLTTLPDEEVIRQVEEDRKNLEALVGYPVVGMAYPCGGVNNDDRVAELIKTHTGIRYCRTITNTDSLAPQENLYRFNPNVYHVLEYDRLMEMGKAFVEATPDEPQILYVWGHAYEMDFHPDDWIKLEEFCKLISGRDDIFYGTNAEVLLG
ncbi:MAG: polysaccharide deacetylase family protein [Clostridia bacterium]|nr:polysaccharide deacetylase family protein [Clostridia bacterium]